MTSSGIKKVYIGICILLVVYLVWSKTCTEIVRTEGILNYKEDRVEIVFEPFSVDLPYSLESDDNYLLSYAAIHDGEKIECDVRIIHLLHENKYCQLSKIYYK